MQPGLAPEGMTEIIKSFREIARAVIRRFLYPEGQVEIESWSSRYQNLTFLVNCPAKGLWGLQVLVQYVESEILLSGPVGII